MGAARFASQLAVLVLVAAAPAGASAIERDRALKDFTAANERALAGDLPGAIALYEHLLAEGVKNEDVYFNLGNAYAESGRLVDAAVAWERALRLAPGDEDTRANLELVRAKLLPKPSEETPAADPVDALEPLVSPLPADAFAWTAVLANAVLFGLLILRRRAAGEGIRRISAAAIGLALVVLLGAGFVVLAQGAVASDRRGVVVQAASLKSGPRAGYSDVGTVPAGERVRILSADDDWLEVKSRAGAAGWVPKAKIQPI